MKFKKGDKIRFLSDNFMGGIGVKHNFIKGNIFTFDHYQGITNVVVREPRFGYVPFASRFELVKPKPYNKSDWM